MTLGWLQDAMGLPWTRRSGGRCVSGAGQMALQGHLQGDMRMKSCLFCLLCIFHGNAGRRSCDQGQQLLEDGFDFSPLLGFTWSPAATGRAMWF